MPKADSQARRDAAEGLREILDLATKDLGEQFTMAPMLAQPKQTGVRELVALESLTL